MQISYFKTKVKVEMPINIKPQDKTPMGVISLKVRKPVADRFKEWCHELASDQGYVLEQVLLKAMPRKGAKSTEGPKEKAKGARA
jgi:hypothetical protein